MSQLSGWENFYVIVGSSAGALIGLTFVAVTLISEVRLRGARLGIDAFNTPTVVHFGAVLFVASLLSAPWPSLIPPTLILVACGLAGAIYSAVVGRRQGRMGRVTGYIPVLEDWLWYVAFPFVAYAALAVVPLAALLLTRSPAMALFAVGTVLVLLLFLGIHNAWDLVTFIAVEHRDRQDEQSERKVGTDQSPKRDARVD